MSYQVLARKWRPRVFKEMVGQEHVLKALINALDNNRLHHAYLFTGTRGVGKTTIARILAKCLNCEQGLTSEPCDQCTSCLEINEGRFVDLIEVDAASRTKVEDTRELLDNVQYAPTKGRYKVYLIDEVHMLSSHSFNALLKTLEEPPPHIKFLLATTDPQKLPVTILSRCLQFNLKNMPPERIVEHLQHVLGEENIEYEVPALWHLGRSADGSMRDALSLTDQAISFGNGKISEAEVGAMLGTIDRSYILSILKALSENDGNEILQQVAAMAEHGPDYEQALAELITLLHRIAIAQVLPESIDNSFGDKESILALAQNFAGEDVQLFYQTALLGRRDLPLAPDPRGGFEMVLLRLLAFKPETLSGQIEKPPAISESNSTATSHKAIAEAKEEPVKKSETVEDDFASSAEQDVIEQSVNSNIETAAQSVDGYKSEEPTKYLHEVPVQTDLSTEIVDEIDEDANDEIKSPATLHSATAVSNFSELSEENWNSLVIQLSLGGVIGNTLSHCQFIEKNDDNLYLLLNQDFATLFDSSHQQRIAQALAHHFNQEINVEIDIGEVTSETPAMMAERIQKERQASAVKAMRTDPLVQDVIQTFSATLREETVTPIDH